MRYQKIVQTTLCCLAVLGGPFFLAESAKAERVTGFQQDENYYIPFNVASRGYYTINLSSHTLADADLYLYDANNALIAKSIQLGSDLLEGNVNPGSYQIRIHMSMCLLEECSVNIDVRRDGRSVRLFR